MGNNKTVLTKLIAEIWKHGGIAKVKNYEQQDDRTGLNKSPGQPDFLGRENEGNNNNITQSVCSKHSSQFVICKREICNLCVSSACESLLRNGTWLACLQPA